jgi:hypothetical protein
MTKTTNQQYTSKPERRRMGNKRWKGNMTPQRGKNYTTEDLMDNEGSDNSVYKIKRMLIKMF